MSLPNVNIFLAGRLRERQLNEVYKAHLAMIQEANLRLKIKEADKVPSWYEIKRELLDIETDARTSKDIKDNVLKNNKLRIIDK